MSANLKWTQQHELELINDVANGKSLESYAQTHNRSVSAVDLRLKKIIYSNYVAGISFEKISQLLKINVDKITQYYYSYKEFKEKHGGLAESKNKEFVEGTSLISGGGQQNGDNNNKLVLTTNNTNNTNNAKSNIGVSTANTKELLNQLNQLNQLGGTKKVNEKFDSVVDKVVDKAFGEPNNLEKIETKLKKLEVENRILKLVVENKELTQQLNKLISEGKVDPSIKQLIKVLRKSIK